MNLTDYLFEHGIELPPNVYDYLCSQQSINKVTNTLNYKEKFIGAEKAMNSNLCLPMYNGLTEKELTYIVEKINQFLKIGE